MSTSRKFPFRAFYTGKAYLGKYWAFCELEEKIDLGPLTLALMQCSGFWSGAGFVIIFYGSGSGSGSLFQQAKNLIKALLSAVSWLLNDFLSLKTNVNVPTDMISKNLFFVGILEDTVDKSRFRKSSVRMSTSQHMHHEIIRLKKFN